MSEKERAFLARFKSVVERHPSIPTDRLRQLLIQSVALHEQTDGTGKPTDKLPILEITACPVIAILRELLKYRDRYGLIELPNENWKFLDDKDACDGHD